VERAADPKTGADPPLYGSFIPTRAGGPVHALIRDQTKPQRQTTKYIVKTIEALTIVASLGLISGSSAFAQGPPGGKPNKQPDFEEVAFKQLSEGYTSIVPFDKNKDGKLNDAELKAIADAWENGSLKLPLPPMPPPPPKDRSGAEDGPPPEMMPPKEVVLPVLASLYEAVAALDADKNGALDANEQGALKKAFKDGKLPLPPQFGGPPMGERPPGPGGPRP
jgi:hypothetical protein